MSNTMRSIRLSILAGLLAISARGVLAQTSSSIDISGTWLLNEKLSDDPMAIFQKRMQQMHASGGGHGGGGEHGGGGGGGGGYGGHHGEGGGGNSHGTSSQGGDHAHHFEAPAKIVILQTDKQVTMIPEGRDTVTVVPDGAEHTRKTPNGDVDVTASWKDLGLDVHIKSAEGREVDRVYRINSDGRLEVVTEMQPLSGDKIEIVARYDPAPSK